MTTPGFTEADSPDLVALARLAMLALEEHDAPSIARDLASILGHVRVLRRLDLTGVEPLSYVAEAFQPALLSPSPLREDTPGPTLPAGTPARLAQQPESDDPALASFIRVPRVLP